MAKRKRPAAPPQDTESDTLTAPPEETAAPAADAAPAPEFNPALDCCNRNSPDENHAPGCGNEPKAPTPAKPDFDPALYRESNVHMSEADRIADSRKILEAPVPPGMKVFESPEGYCMLGEADKEHVFCRHANGGAGMNINPRR